MHSFSYWEKNSFFSNIDVAIIGSGIVGLTAAINIKTVASQLNVVILERGFLPSGASTKNAGFACFGSMTELVDDLKERDESAVFELVQERWEGLRKLRKLLGDNAIQFKQLGGYELFCPEDENSFQECLSHLQSFNMMLAKIIGQKEVFQVKDHLINKFGFGKTQHLIFNQAEGQIDTGAMMKQLIKKATSLGITIFNGLEISNLEDLNDKVRMNVPNGISFIAQKVIAATNGFSAHLINDLELKPARNQVILTEPIHDLPFDGCFHIDRGYFYFRSMAIKNSTAKRILFGGGRNLSPIEETTSEFGHSEIVLNALKNKLNEIVYPEKDLKVEMKWSGILGIGPTKQPIIKKVSPNTYAAVRLGGMGVAIGTLVGEKVSNMVLSEL